MSIDLLAGLLDEKLIRIMKVFIKNSDKKFYLSEIAKISKVNPASTFRILNKLVKEEFVKAAVIGKVRMYKLSSEERARSLSKILKEDDSDPLKKFVDKIKMIPRISLVLLDSKTTNSAKVIVVGEYSSKERIETLANEVNDSCNFKIEFVEINVRQFKELRSLKTFDLNKKILYKKTI